jgi:hypothetical protein
MLSFLGQFFLSFEKQFGGVFGSYWDFSALETQWKDPITRVCTCTNRAPTTTNASFDYIHHLEKQLVGWETSLQVGIFYGFLNFRKYCMRWVIILWGMWMGLSLGFSRWTMVVMPRRKAKRKEANMTWFLCKTKIMNVWLILGWSITS